MICAEETKFIISTKVSKISISKLPINIRDLLNLNNQTFVFMMIYKVLLSIIRDIFHKSYFNTISKMFKFKISYQLPFDQ